MRAEIPAEASAAPRLSPLLFVVRSLVKVAGERAAGAEMRWEGLGSDL